MKHSSRTRRETWTVGIIRKEHNSLPREVSPHSTSGTKRGKRIIHKWGKYSRSKLYTLVDARYTDIAYDSSKYVDSTCSVLAYGLVGMLLLEALILDYDINSKLPTYDCSDSPGNSRNSRPTKVLSSSLRKSSLVQP